MIRLAAVAVAVASFALASGCNPAPPPLTEVDIYWEFDRYTLIDGVEGSVRYDHDVNWPPGTGDGACPQSGVDYVTITDDQGNPVTGNVPCINQSVQGAALGGFPGPNTYWVTGWRRGVALPLYTGSVTVNVVDANPVMGTVVAAGIPSDLTVDMVLPPYDPVTTTCGIANVDSFDGWVEDGFGTLIWKNTILCDNPAYIPSIQYGLVDRDDLFLWIDVYSGPNLLWSKCNYGFGHYSDDLFSLTIDPGVCLPAPPP